MPIPTDHAGHGPTSKLRSAWTSVGAAIYEPILATGERRGMAARRRELLAGANGRVLEIGAGTGLNLHAYPAGLDALVLTEPEPAMARRLARRAARQRPEAQVVEAGAERLPFEAGSFDVVVSTMVLCTVPDVEATISEVRRVLRPGGRLLYVEHVRSADPRLARWQERLAGPWRAFASGCSCDRPTLDVLEAAFAVQPPSRATWDGMPAIVRPLVSGVAIRG